MSPLTNGEEKFTFESSAEKSCLPVAFLLPGVGVVVVAALLPEARAVSFHKLQAVEPFRAFIEVKFGYEQTNGTTVLGCKIFSVVLEGNHHIIVIEIAEREIGGIACPGVGHDEFGTG